MLDSIFLHGSDADILRSVSLSIYSVYYILYEQNICIVYMSTSCMPDLGSPSLDSADNVDHGCASSKISSCKTWKAQDVKNLKWRTDFPCMFCCGSLKRHFESFFAGDKMVQTLQNIPKLLLASPAQCSMVFCSKLVWPGHPRGPQRPARFF